MKPSDFHPKNFGLPHAEPFVFVDTVDGTRSGEWARCSVCFGADRDFFRGHFPGNPIVPGVILTEALAQTAGIAAGSGSGAMRRFLLSAIRSMKFKRAVLPGELVSLEAAKRGEMAGLFQFETVARVNGEVVAEGQIVLTETGL
ncbi:MAG TPA: 3-hydroxyacyl-ACP dehydratase FabZ family protein [Chthoniobacterales bacterium]